MNSPLRRRIAAAALVLCAPAAAACTNGFHEQTDQQYQPGVGINDHSGSVDILNAAVVAGDDNRGTLSVTLINHSDTPDRLISLTGANIASGRASVALPSDRPVKLWQTGKVVVSGPKVVPGDFVTFTLDFQNGQSSKLTVPVVTQSGDFAQVPLPSPTATASE